MMQKHCAKLGQNVHKREDTESDMRLVPKVLKSVGTSIGFACYATHELFRDAPISTCMQPLSMRLFCTTNAGHDWIHGCEIKWHHRPPRQVSSKPNYLS